MRLPLITTLLALPLAACISRPFVPGEVRRGWIPVGHGHQIYFEDVGPRDAIPGVYVHGGPGSGSNPSVRRLFDPTKYRVITWDQRGTGQSRYVDLLAHNTSADLVADMEALRAHLGVERWVVVGGSWGATLGLLYAETYPERVRAMVLSGIFLGTRRELPWLRPGDHPIRWRSFSKGKTDPTLAHHREMEDSRTTDQRRTEIAGRWQAYEKSIKDRAVADAPLELGPVTPNLVRGTRIKLAYLAHDSFLDHDLLARIDRVRMVPGFIVQGTADAVCPAEGAAARLRAAWPEAWYRAVPGGGHSASDERMAAALSEVLAELPP